MAGARTLQRGLEVLVAVRDAGRQLSMTDVARTTGLDRAVIARLMPPLVDAGFIVAHGSPPKYVIGTALGGVTPNEDSQEASMPQDLDASLPSVGPSDFDGTWTGFDRAWDGGGPNLSSSSVGSDAGYSDVMVDDAYFALMSLVGGMPMSHVAERVFGGSTPPSFVGMMGDITLDELGPDHATIVERMRDIDPVAAFRMFFDELSERDRDILRDRLAADPETLESLGERHGITRERARQIVKGLHRTFQTSLETNAAIIERTAIARTSIGGIVDMEELRVALLTALPMVRCLAMELDQPFLFLLFPEGSFARYGDKSSWFADEVTRRRLTDIRARALADGIPTTDLLDAVPALRASDRLSSLLAIMGLQEIDGEIVASNLSLNERTVRLLGRTGGPIAFHDIVEVLRAGDRARSLRNALLVDDRITRVDKDTFALEEWGLTAYTTVRDLIREEIASSGGEARVADIKERLTARFDIKASSIVAYAKGPDFVYIAPGVIRLRADDEVSQDLERPLHSLRGCVRIRRRWAFRVEVTTSVLRGFSVLLPNGMGPHFGVAQGESALLSTDLSGDISVVRRGLQDNIGRLRWVAEELGLGAGDVLFVLLPERESGRISFSGLVRSDIDSANARRRAGLLLGQGEDLTLPLACSALGMHRDSRPAEVADLIRSRGEEELATLVGEVLGEGPMPEVDTRDIARMLGL